MTSGSTAAKALKRMVKVRPRLGSWENAIKLPLVKAITESAIAIAVDFGEGFPNFSISV